MNLPAWSYTMLDTFDTCPRKAFHQYVLKEKGPKTAAMEEGNRLDKAIENRILNGEVLPPEFQPYEAMACSVANMRAGNKITVQAKFGIDRQFKPVPFFDGNVWGRGALDVLMYNYPNAIILDWKTGKNNENKPYYDKGLQLKIFAAMTFKHYPKVDKITAFNIYLKENKIGMVYTWERADEFLLWREILPRVLLVEEAFKAYIDNPVEPYAVDAFCMKPGPLCGYCPVKQCQHNKS
jgi:hypothetical protein